MAKHQRSSGLVVLAGAGPGDESLATTAAAEWISRADVIVYDRLIAPALLRGSRRDAQRIYVGKTPGTPGPNQRAINRLLIRHARAGRLVVRSRAAIRSSSPAEAKRPKPWPPPALPSASSRA